MKIWGSEFIPKWVGFHILILNLVPWALWHVEVLLQRGPTCDFLSWLSRLGLIFEFLRQVFRGGSQLILHGWFQISSGLDGVWGGAWFDVRAVVMNRSWWWNRDVGIWISLSRSWLPLEGWNCGMLRRSWIQIIVGIFMGQTCYCLRSPLLSYRNFSSHLLEVLVGILWQSGWDYWSNQVFNNTYEQWGLFWRVELNVDSTCLNRE